MRIKILKVLDLHNYDITKDIEKASHSMAFVNLLSNSFEDTCSFKYFTTLLYMESMNVLLFQLMSSLSHLKRVKTQLWIY
jgi:hypothetical protein